MPAPQASPTSSPGVSLCVPMAGSTSTDERSANHASASARHAADTVLASARGPDRPGTNGATAMRLHASKRPTTADQASARCGAWPATSGAITKMALEAAEIRKPVQRKRSRRRPSTAKRIPASSAMIAAAKAITVLQHEPELRQGDLRLELVVRDEERQRGAEQAKKEDLSPEPGLEIVSAVLPHVHSFGRTSSADKRCNRDG